MRRVAPVLYVRKSEMYTTSAQKVQLKMTIMAVPRAIVFYAETEMPGHGKAPCIVFNQMYMSKCNLQVYCSSHDGLLRKTLYFQIAWA